RGAFVQILDGTTLGLLATSFTGLDGVYSATVTADSVQVRVFSRDLDGTRVRVFYAGQPNSPYFLQYPVTPMAAGATIDITSEQPIRGIPGAQSPDTPGDRNARAFSVYDAMITYWLQANLLTRGAMPAAMVNFYSSSVASPGGGPCP